MILDAHARVGQRHRSRACQLPAMRNLLLRKARGIPILPYSHRESEECRIKIDERATSYILRELK
jgi:hypothetical protein